MFQDGEVGSRGDFMVSLGVLYCMGCMVTHGCRSWVFVLVFPWLLRALFFVVVLLGGPERLQALTFMGVSYGGAGRVQAPFFLVFCGAGGLQALSSAVVLTGGPERLFWYCRICVGLVLLMICLFSALGNWYVVKSFVAYLWFVLIVSGIVL